MSSIGDRVLQRLEQLSPIPLHKDLAERIAQRFGLVVHRRTVARALMRLKKKAR